MKKIIFGIMLTFTILFSFSIKAEALSLNSFQVLDNEGVKVEELHCEDVPKVYEVVQMLFNYVKIIIPLLLIIFVMIDLVKATASGSADEMKKAQKSAMTRAFAAIAIFFLPSIINLVLRFAGIYNGTCGVS